MLITKVLLETEISNMEQRVKSAEAQLHQLNGAVVVLKDLLRYHEAEEPAKPAENTEIISAENAAIQARDEKFRQERVEMADAVTDDMVEEAKERG